jgi:competence protein ComEA
MKPKNRIRSGWKEYFNFSTREKKGAFYLSLIITIQLLILLALRFYQPEISAPEKAQFLKIMSELQNTEVQKPGPVKHEHSNSAFVKIKFNPNSAADSVFFGFGLSTRQVATIRKYLSKGGQFRVKNDLAKMYSIDSMTFSSMEQYIDLPDVVSVKKTPSFQKHSVIDLSVADSVSLVELKGIGPSLASRILKYRNALGGFTTVEQLKEVYGISDSLFDFIRSSVMLPENPMIRYIDLNNDSVSVLMAHPYIRYKLAYAIVNYRKHHGRINSVEDLKKLPLMTDEVMSKLPRYLKF